MNLSDAGTLRAFIQKHGLAARKGLGQHFLCSPNAVKSIVSAVQDCVGILEIGPGPGVLTGPLSEFAEVVALELDDRMIEALRESAPRALVQKQDALEADLGQTLTALPEPRAVVSNLPYYITGPLLTKIASAKSMYRRAVLMMQKEVGLRILAPAGDSARGSLSVFLQAQFEIAKVAQVPAGAFLPPPKVDSVVLSFVPLPDEDDPKMFDWVRAGFTQPRKTLANNLASEAGISRERVVAVLESVGLDPKVRPHALEVAQWRSLWNLLGDGHDRLR